MDFAVQHGLPVKQIIAAREDSSADSSGGDIEDGGGGGVGVGVAFTGDGDDNVAINSGSRGVWNSIVLIQY